jgi:hypothetical protein
MSMKDRFTSYQKQSIYKSEAYLTYIRSLDCVGCDDGVYEVNAHHEGFGIKAMGKNLIPDSQALPLCVKCHVPRRHTMGYRTFWKAVNLDPKLIVINCLTNYLILLDK